MDTVPSIYERYTGNRRVHQLMALRLIRPHPGARMTKQDGQRLGCTGNSFRTQGLDVFLILIRMLISLGYELNTVTSSPSVQSKALFQLAEKDLGWKYIEDLFLKRQLIDLFDNYSLSEIQSLSFKDLLEEPGLHDLIICNSSFRLIGDFVALISNGKLADLIPNPADTPATITYKALRFDSSTSLSEFISSLFSPKPNGGLLTSSEATFVAIRYTVLPDSTTPITELATFNLEAPIIWSENGQRKKGMQRNPYRLCAVVRMARFAVGNDNPNAKPEMEVDDSIWLCDERVSEIKPGNVGSYALKVSAGVHGGNWTVEEPGEYLLVYFRVIIKK